MKARLIGIAALVVALTILAGCGGSSSHFDGNQNGQHHTPEEFEEIHAREFVEKEQEAEEELFAEKEAEGMSHEEAVEEVNREAENYAAEAEAEITREGVEAQGKCYEEMQAESASFGRMQEVCGPLE